jgi:hypothetical protein
MRFSAPGPFRSAASAPAMGRSDALAQRVADLFALVAIAHRGHSIAADWIADLERRRCRRCASLGGIREIEGVPPGGRPSAA